jgi:hypothetical protein
MARSKLTAAFDVKEAKTQNVKTSKSYDALTSKSATRQMSLRISDAAWRELQMLRIETGRPVNKLLIDAVNEYLSRNGKAPVA